MPDIVGRLRTPRLSAAPSSPVVGEMYYDTTTNILYWWNGTVWTSASGGGAVGSTKYSYTFSALTGTPNSGEIRLDAAIGSATKLRAHQTSLGTLTMYDLESHAKPGSIILMASSNRIYSIFRVTTSAILAGYIELGITYLGSGDVNDASAGTVNLEVIPGYAIPTGGTTGQVLTKTSATNYAAAWQAAGGGATDLRYNGSWVAGSYTDGDIVIYNGISYIAVRTTTQTPVAWPSLPSPVAYGTTLPGSAIDGQEAILVDSITNPTYQWKFRYNAGSSSAYKWEFIGGPPLQIYPGTFNNPTANAYNADTAPGSTLTIPRAGDYSLSSLAGVVATVGGYYMGFAYDPNTRQGGNLVAGTEAEVFVTVKKTCTAGEAVRNIFYTINTDASYVRRTITAIPWRVS
jgi:hypothetical protein